MMRATTAVAMVAMIVACGGSEDDSQRSDLPAEVLEAPDMSPAEPSAEDAGSTSTDAGFTVTPSVTTYPRYLATLHEAHCERDARCDAASEGLEACVSAREAEVDQDKYQAFLEAIDRGALAYSAPDAQACVDALAGSCDEDAIELLKICNEVLEGQVPVGQACTVMSACADAEGASPGGPFCYDGCDPIDGEPGRQGVCVLRGPVLDPECMD